MNRSAQRSLTTSSVAVLKQNVTKASLIQFSRYLVGGSIYFWTGYGIFALGYSVFHWWWFWAKVLGDSIGWTLNYLIQRYWAFAGQAKHLSEMKHATRYLLIESFGFVLDYAIVGGLKYLGLTPYIGAFISAGFFTFWSYLWYKYWVFPEQYASKK